MLAFPESNGNRPLLAGMEVVRPTRRIGVASDFVMEKISHACVVNCVRLNSVTVVF